MVQTSYTILWAPAQNGIQAKVLEARVKDGRSSIPILIPGKPALEYLVNGFAVFSNKDEKGAAAKKFINSSLMIRVGSTRSVDFFPVHASFTVALRNDKRMETISGWTKYYSPYYNTIDGFC